MLCMCVFPGYAGVWVVVSQLCPVFLFYRAAVLIDSHAAVATPPLCFPSLPAVR